MPNVILADNDAKRRNKLARALEKAHYTVRTAVDAPNALEEVRAARPDILVLDWRRPRTESRRQILLALFAECKERFPVLALAEAIDKARDALAHGAQDYVRKPVDTAELVERVERMLRNAGAVGPQADRGRPKLSIGLSELHNAESGRIDASNVSVYLGVSLADLARAVGANYKTIHKTPDAEAIQDGLAPIKRSLGNPRRCFRQRDLRPYLA
ncbi:MAG: response regulator [Deltaproteobacteria bacterium]|nr:response regulator [Deltaproteobacteria bacterium]